MKAPGRREYFDQYTQEFKALYSNLTGIYGVKPILEYIEKRIGVAEKVLADWLSIGLPPGNWGIRDRIIMALKDFKATDLEFYGIKGQIKEVASKPRSEVKEPAVAVPAEPEPQPVTPQPVPVPKEETFPVAPLVSSKDPEPLEQKSEKKKPGPKPKGHEKQIQKPKSEKPNPLADLEKIYPGVTKEVSNSINSLKAQHGWGWIKQEQMNALGVSHMDIYPALKLGFIVKKKNKETGEAEYRVTM